MEEFEVATGGKRSSIIAHIHRILFINELKHLDAKKEESVEFDAEECAIAAILKAIVDYKTLTGEHSQAMKAFIAWTYVNLDSATMMEKYKNASKHLAAD